jgi:hypothetical protein
VFITNGPYCTIGSPMGSPPSKITSSALVRLSWTASAASVIRSPAPNTAIWPAWIGSAFGPTVPAPAMT